MSELDEWDDWDDEDDEGIDGDVDVLIGVQTPRLENVPKGHPGRGELAVQFVREVGMSLLPWQEDCLRDFFRVRRNGKWSSREFVGVVPRQNGKGELLVAIELCAIFLFGCRTIFHTAHLMDTAIDAQKRLWSFIEGNDDLIYWRYHNVKDLAKYEHDFDPKLMPRLQSSNGKENIEFPALKCTVYFRTRTAKTARGMSVDLLIYDECYNLPNQVFSAMDSTTRARKNSQKIFISSPVDRFEHVHGAVFSAKRWAGIDHKRGVLLKEWSAAPDDDPLDPEVWKKANPSLGPVAQYDDLEAAAAAAAASEELMLSFKVESLAAGNWYPRKGENLDEFIPIIDTTVWESMVSVSPRVVGECCMAADVAPGGSSASLVAALETDKGYHLTLHNTKEFEREALVAGIIDTVELNDPLAVVVDPKSPAATLIRMLEDGGVEPETVGARTVGEACELFLALVDEGKITHDGDPRWLEALSAAEFRLLNGKRALTRRSENADITPLVAATFAVWGLQSFSIPRDVTANRVESYVAPAPVKIPGARGVEF